MEGKRSEFQIAIELGQALAESKELLRLRKAQAELHLNKEAQRLFSDLRAGRFKPGEQTIQGNPVINELLSAEEEFNRLMTTINGIIGFYVTGKETITVPDKGCSGCTGCKEVRGHTSTSG
jgi:cell fate (sporulation/competence/biofilm development) regulator YlbF (YheA/YmcA/DUF963 family)